MAAHGELEAGAGGTAGLFGDLQADTVEDDGVVLADHAGVGLAQDLVEIEGGEGDEGSGRVGRGSREGLVVVGEEAFAQIGIGGGGSGDGGHSRLVDQAILQGAIEAFAAAAGLGRIGGDVLNARLFEGSADLGEGVLVHRAASLGGVKGPMGAIGIERHGQAMGGESTSRSALMTATVDSAGQNWA